MPVMPADVKKKATLEDFRKFGDVLGVEPVQTLETAADCHGYLAGKASAQGQE